MTKLDTGVPGLLSVKSSDKVFEALEMMDKYNLSTIPVIDGEECVGSISESEILEKIISDRNVSGKNVKQVMEKKLQSVDFDMPFPKAQEILQKDHTLLVSQHGIIKGILTRYDVLDFA